MKNIFESGETFEAAARLDYCIWTLKHLQGELAGWQLGFTSQSPIVAMVDKATGFEKARMKEYKAAAIELLKEVIASKKLLEIETKQDEEYLAQIKNME